MNWIQNIPPQLTTYEINFVFSFAIDCELFLHQFCTKIENYNIWKEKENEMKMWNQKKT